MKFLVKRSFAIISDGDLYNPFSCSCRARRSHETKNFYQRLVHPRIFQRDEQSGTPLSCAGVSRPILQVTKDPDTCN